MFEDIKWKKVLHDAIAQAASKAIVWISLAVLGGLVFLGEWLLNTGVVLPGWLVGLLAGVILVLGWAAWPRVADQDGVAADPENELQEQIIRSYVDRSDDYANLTELSESVVARRVRLRLEADRMADAGLLEYMDHMHNDEYYRITRKGREWLVRVGYA